MARRRINFEKDEFYHVYNRGVQQSDIFQETENYLFLLKQVQTYSDQFNITIVAYCLMPNHYHFLVRQDSKKSVSKFIQRIFNCYTKAYNNRYDRKGTLFEGPYKAIHINDESYLIHLCRYIHRNPLEAGIVDKIGKWPFSNVKEWLDLRNGTLINNNFRDVYFNSGEDYLSFLTDVESPKKLDKYLFE